jgi:hypothetical protein
MHRHEFDPVSLFAGVLFAIVAAGYTLTHTTGLRLHWLLAIPVVLLVMGAAVVAVVVRRMRPGSQEPAAPGM